MSQMRLVGLLMVQSGFKHLLTEGDKVLQLAELADTYIKVVTRHRVALTVSYGATKLTSHSCWHMEYCTTMQFLVTVKCSHFLVRLHCSLWSHTI
jgi:hypothetical protein